MKWCCLLLAIPFLFGCTYTDTGNRYEKPEDIGAYEPDARDLVTVMDDVQSLLEKTAEQPVSVDCAKLKTAVGPEGAFVFGAVFTACHAEESRIVYSGSFLQESRLSEDNTVKEISITLDVTASGGPFTTETSVALEALFHPQEEVYSSVSASLAGVALEDADIVTALEKIH